MKTLAIAAILAVTGVLLCGARTAAAACNDADPCAGGPVRVMIVLDGSSALLNDGNGPAAMDTSTWDRLRDAIADDPDSIFDRVVNPPAIVLSQIAHVGLVTFGDPGQEVRVIDYGPCTRPNLDWALDPRTSCEEPGCTDPWGGPPIEWTSKDGSTIDPPDFAQRTVSTMPHCDGAGACSGSGRAVHAGIELATENQADYHAATDYTHDDSTQYINILIIAGEYDAANDAQVQAALEAAYDEGTITYVIGFDIAGPGMTPFQDQLDAMAQWGSAGTAAARVVDGEPALRDTIGEIVGALQLPCCYTIDCSAVGGADSGGIGNDAGNDDGAADGAEWGSLDGEGSASGGTEGGGGDATADGSSGASAEAGFDDDGGCRCSTRSAGTPWWLIAGFGVGRRRARRRMIDRRVQAPR